MLRRGPASEHPGDRGAAMIPGSVRILSLLLAIAASAVTIIWLGVHTSKPEAEIDYLQWVDATIESDRCTFSINEDGPTRYRFRFTRSGMVIEGIVPRARVDPDVEGLFESVTASDIPARKGFKLSDCVLLWNQGSTDRYVDLSNHPEQREAIARGALALREILKQEARQSPMPRSSLIVGQDLDRQGRFDEATVLFAEYLAYEKRQLDSGSYGRTGYFDTLPLAHLRLARVHRLAGRGAEAEAEEALARRDWENYTTGPPTARWREYQSYVNYLPRTGASP